MSALKVTTAAIAAALTLSLAAVSTQAFGKGFFDEETPKEKLQKQGITVTPVKNIPREFSRLADGTYDVTGNVEKPCRVTVFTAPVNYPMSTRSVVATDCKFK